MANFSKLSKDDIVRNGNAVVADPPTTDDTDETTETPSVPATRAITNEPVLDAILAAGQIILDLVYNTGQATKVEMRTACKEKGHATDVYQKAFARLYNQAKVITEVTREDGSKAYELKRAAAQAKAAGLDIVAILELQEESAGPVKKRESFDGWYTATGTFTVRSPIMSSRPVLGNPSARHFLRAIPRNDEDYIMLSGGNYDAMFKETCKNGPAVPKIGNGIFHVFWAQQELAAKQLETQLNPVPPSRPGQSGQGITEVEAIPVGTVIPFEVMAPASHCPPQVLAVILQRAGKFIGFSPSGAHKGWGRFDVKLDWKEEYAQFGMPKINADGTIEGVEHDDSTLEELDVDAMRETAWNE